MANGSSLFNDIVVLSGDYLGPAAERFVTRQVHFHLKKEPAELNHHDISQLVEWLRVSMSVITQNEKLIEEYMGRVTDLQESTGSEV